MMEFPNSLSVEGAIKKIKPLSAEPDLSEIVPADRQLQVGVSVSQCYPRPVYVCSQPFASVTN